MGLSFQEKKFKVDFQDGISDRNDFRYMYFKSTSLADAFSKFRVN